MTILGRSEELVSRCVECDLAEPESLASLGGSAPGVFDGILSTPAANKSAEQHEEPSEQDSFNHLLYKVLRLNSEQVQDLNDWMAH